MSKKHAFLGVFCVMIFISISHYSCIKDKGEQPEAVSQSLCDSLNVTYMTVIKPMVVNNCATLNCHDGSGGAPLDLNTYVDLKTFFDNGQLKDRVFTKKDMPQTGPLPDSLLQKLQCWMNDGAPNN